jgi:hypothetical protein
MAARTAEQLKEKSLVLRQKVQEKKDSMEAAALRETRKKIRRVQRKARRLKTAAERAAAQSSKKSE